MLLLRIINIQSTMRAFTDSYNSLKSPESRQNIMTESLISKEVIRKHNNNLKVIKKENDKYKCRSLHSTYVLNIDGMQSDQTDQVQKILEDRVKDFPCSLKKKSLCPADDFLYLPEMRDQKICIGKKNWGIQIVF